MAAKLCKEQQISFGNSTKYSDFIGGKYILLHWRLKGPYCSKKTASSKKISRYFLLKFLVSALIDIINMPEEFPKNRWSRSPQLKIAQNSAVKFFGISKINYYQVEGDTSSNFRYK